MTIINFPIQGETERSQDTAINKDQDKPSTSSEDYSKWGYDLYPDRKRKPKERSISDYMFGKGREPTEKIRCERTVYQCIKTSPLVKLMLGALRASGCAVDIRRHISCEECAVGVTGGYDPILNQVSFISKISIPLQYSGL